MGLLLALLCLTGCAREDPFRVDTVIYIPADPADVTVEAARPETVLPSPAEPAAPTQDPAPEETEADIQPEETVPAPTGEAGKNSSSKKPTSSKKPASGKNNNSKPTEPPATEPAETNPAATEPAQTEPPATEPPVTEAPEVTQPPATDPGETQPAGTESPAAEPPATEPEPTDPPLYDISGYSVGSLEYAVRDAINAYRTAEGLGELSLSSRLCAIASCRGYEISRVWSHTRPDGRSYGTVLADYGYGGSARELLIYVSGSGDAQAIVDKWMGSDAQKELLLGNFSTVGIGVYRSGGYSYIACLLVG